MPTACGACAGTTRRAGSTSKTFDRAADARAFEGKVRTKKRADALADLDAGTETLAEFGEQWWRLYATPNLERSTLKGYAALWTPTCCRCSAPTGCATSLRR